MGRKEDGELLHFLLCKLSLLLILHVLDMEMHEPLKPPRHTSPPCRDAHNLDVVVLKFTLLNFKQHRIKPPAAYTPHPDYTEALLHVIALFFCDFLVKVFFFF